MKKFGAFGLRSPVPYVHTEGMQVTAHLTSVFGQKAMNSQNCKANGKRPAPNLSIEGMPKRLRLLCTTHVKR